MFVAAFLSQAIAGLMSCMTEVHERSAKQRTSLQQLDSGLTYGSMFVLAVLLCTIISFVSGTDANSALQIICLCLCGDRRCSLRRAHRRLRSMHRFVAPK